MDQMKMFIPLALVYGMKNVDSTDPTILFNMRAFFGVSLVFQLAFWAYMWQRVSANKDKRILKVKQADLQPQNPIGSMLGADKLLPQDIEEMTVSEYDQKILGQRIQQVMMGGLIVGGMHLYMKIAIPLVISAAMGMLNLHSDPLVRIYVKGEKEMDDPEALKRPFKAKNPFGDAMKKMEDAKKSAEMISDKSEKKKARKGTGNPKKNR
jgi:hypothetical protein